MKQLLRCPIDSLVAMYMYYGRSMVLRHVRLTARSRAKRNPTADNASSDIGDEPGRLRQVIGAAARAAAACPAEWLDASRLRSARRRVLEKRYGTLRRAHHSSMCGCVHRGESGLRRLRAVDHAGVLHVFLHIRRLHQEPRLQDVHKNPCSRKISY